LIPCRARLLLDDLRAQLIIDTALHGRAAAVRLVDGLRQLDGPRAEVAGPLALTNLVLDSPERFIDRLELGGQGGQDLAIEDRPVARFR
jgi:hypothetical protein